MKLVQGPTDRAIITALLADDRLTYAERDAFEGMSRRLERWSNLTPPQRQWATDVYERLELDSDEAANLYSTGQAPKGKPVATPEVLRRLPLKPPGRK
jgi:hypothetical protein